MTFAAISYMIKPGFDDEIAEIFSPANFKRVDSPNLKNADGGASGRLTATGLFLQGDIMVRVIQYEGDLADVSRHMSAQRGVREAEERLAPYLRERRDTESTDGFMQYFQRSTLRCIQHRVIRDRPAMQLAAMRHTIKPGAADTIAEVFADLKPAAQTELHDADDEVSGLIDAVALFVQGQTMVRVVQYEGELADVARFMASWSARSNLEARLEPYLDEDRAYDTPAEFDRLWWRANMRRISMLSLASLPASNRS